MHTPPRVYFRQFNPTEYTGHDYYRMEIPARILDKMGVAVTRDNELFARSEGDFVSHFAGVVQMDVYHCFSTGGPAMESIQRMLRTLPPTEGFPPPVWITDVDDNLDYIHPCNPSFRTLGTRMPNGQRLVELMREPPEERVINILLPDGEAVPIWEDGKKGFDILRNWKGLNSLNRIMRRAHGVTVPTERLAAYYRKAHRLENVYVLPNSVVFEDYPDIRLAPTPGEVRVLWWGGASHYPDFYPLAHTLREAAARFPEVRWIIWGDRWPWIDKALPPERTEFHGWVPYEAFRIKLAAMAFDIALIPLVDNRFAEGKSCIKWYEASALPRPRPALIARTPPYADEVRDGETGVVFDMPTRADEVSVTFLAGLEALVRDPELRARIAGGAREWVAANVQASVTVPKWWEWVQQTYEVYRERKMRRADARLPHARGDADLRDDVRARLPRA